MPSASPPRTLRLTTVLRLAGLAAGVALLFHATRNVDLAVLHASLASLGPAGLLILVPHAIGLVLHAAAWQRLLASRGTRTPLFTLTRMFMASEAARMTFPAGEAVGESVSTYALVEGLGVPWQRAIAAVAAKKAWVLLTNAIWLVVALVLGREAIARLAARIGSGGAWLAPGAALMAAAMAAVGSVTLLCLGSDRARRVAVMAFARLPVRFRPALEPLAPPAAAPHGAVAAHAGAALLLLGQWFTEALETWLVLRLLGTEISPLEALVVELGGALVRSAAFFVPGGVGVQDASYVGILAGLGVPGAATAGVTFVLLKRSKELVYIALGLAAFLRGRRAPAAADAEAPRA